MMYLAIKYAVFAGIATLVNIGSQWLVLYVYKNRLSLHVAINNEKIGLYIAMACGTLTGLVVKYFLDKKFIFYHTTETKKEDARKFIIYSCMGVFTTLIFWGSELAFHHLFAFPQAKFIGAVVGLGIGYITKYRLDKRFVFVALK